MKALSFLKKLVLWFVLLSSFACNSDDFSSATDRKDTAKDDGADGDAGGTDKSAPGTLPCAKTKTCNDPIDPGKPDEPVVPLPPPDASIKVPQFAMLVNDPTCAFCHLKIQGDIASTKAVLPVWNKSIFSVDGTWRAARSFDIESLGADLFGPTLPQQHPLKSKECQTPQDKSCIRSDHFGSGLKMEVSGGVQAELKLEARLPKDLDKDGFADFPKLDLTKVAAESKGQLTLSDGKKIRGKHQGNLAAIGTKEKPIVIEGEVFIKGDLIIKGYYSGIGNIYASGNIYIPADLRASNSAFPFAKDAASALVEAKKAIKDKKDALGLATPNSILISDLDTHDASNRSVFDPAHWAVPTDRDYDSLAVQQVFQWYKKSDYDKLYEKNPIVCNPAKDVNNRTFSLIESFLYAGNTIGGRANNNSYAINGGIIADHFHIIAAAAACPETAHPVHGLPANWNSINFDYRLRAGLPILHQLAPYFHELEAVGSAP